MSTNLRILIADEEEKSRSFMADALKEKDYNFDVASNPDESIKMLDKDIYDLIIFDIWSNTMPGHSLFEKAKEYNEFIEGIVVTGAISIYSVLDSYRLGIFDFISKPFQGTEELLNAIEGVSRKRVRWLKKLHSLDYQKEKAE